MDPLFCIRVFEDGDRQFQQQQRRNKPRAQEITSIKIITQNNQLVACGLDWTRYAIPIFVYLTMLRGHKVMDEMIRASRPSKN